MPLERRDLTRLMDMLHYARVAAKIIHETALSITWPSRPTKRRNLRWFAAWK